MASEFTGPLSDHLRKPLREHLQWTKDLLCRLNQLRGALTSHPVLLLPKPVLPFALRPDVSNFVLGAVLLKYYNGIPRPVGYASRKLLDRKRNYATIHGETIAILFGITKFDFYRRV